MPCRIGITTRPDARRAEWLSKVIGFKNWQLSDPYHKKEDAQAAENFLAKQYGCVASHGGQNANGPWFVYRFEYTRTK
jgi:hypothetical protein